MVGLDSPRSDALVRTIKVPIIRIRCFAAVRLIRTNNRIKAGKSFKIVWNYTVSTIIYYI